MKLKSLNKYLSFFIIFFSSQILFADDQIDIWSKTKKEKSKDSLEKTENIDTNNNTQITNTAVLNNNIQIDNEISEETKNIKIFGVFDPEDNDFDLNMWSQTDADNVRSSMKRISKIKLSNTATKLFESTILSFAYPPKGMEEEEFLNLKIDWLIENKRIGLIEKFLKQNQTFPNKKKLIQYLVDNNIAKADIKEGCSKINFLDKDIKDSYLEKFKIYCLVYDKKNSEAQLQLDILKKKKNLIIFLTIK